MEMQDFTPVFPVLCVFSHFIRALTKGMLLKICNCASQWLVGTSMKIRSLSLFIINSYSKIVYVKCNPCSFTRGCFMKVRVLEMQRAFQGTLKRQFWQPTYRDSNSCTVSIFLIKTQKDRLEEKCHSGVKGLKTNLGLT